MQIEKNAAGAVRVAQHQIRYLSSKNFEVHVFADRIDKESVIACGGIPHKALLWKGTGHLRRVIFAWQAQRLAKKLRADLVIGHGDLQQQDVLFLHNTVHLAHELIHGAPLSSKHEMYRTHTPQLKDQRFKLLVANSQMMKRDLIKRFNIPENKITVAYPAINNQRFTVGTPEDRLRTRGELGISADTFLVGLVTSGNFKKRGLDLYLEAIKLLPATTRAKAKFVLAGKDAPPETDLITHLPIRSDVENYYRALDLFVLPARIEEFGLVVPEAAACGCDILISDTVGSGELFSAKNIKIHPLNAEILSRMMNEKILLTNPKDKNLIVDANLASEAQTEKVYDDIFKAYL